MGYRIKISGIPYTYVKRMDGELHEDQKLICAENRFRI
jgi:hypothetical protein